MVQISLDYIKTEGRRANVALVQNCKWIVLFIPRNVNCFWSYFPSFFFFNSILPSAMTTLASHLCSPGFVKPYGNVFAPSPGVLAVVLKTPRWPQVNIFLLVHFCLPALWSNILLIQRCVLLCSSQHMLANSYRFFFHLAGLACP